MKTLLSAAALALAASSANAGFTTSTMDFYKCAASEHVGAILLNPPDEPWVEEFKMAITYAGIYTVIESIANTMYTNPEDYPKETNMWEQRTNPLSFITEETSIAEANLIHNIWSCAERSRSRVN